MHQLIIIIQFLLIISPSKSENVEVTTTAAFQTSTTKNPEKLTKIEENTQLVQTGGYMYPIYPATGYFYPGVAPPPMSREVKSYNYFYTVLPAAQMAFEIVRNLFLYLLVRHFVLRIVKIFDLILDVRELLVTDELSHYLTKAALQAGLKLFTKLGLFLMGGAGLLVLGGIFTTLICYLTPICTISFAGYDFNKALDKDTMRSLMTPEKIASAAALVQDAIGKYQRLQREVGQ